MPRFYFHLHNDVDVPDREGIELPNLDAAAASAGSQARALIAAMAADEGRIVLHHRIDIEDDDGALLASIRFGDVVTIER